MLLYYHTLKQVVRRSDPERAEATSKCNCYLENSTGF
jgi:hypothetical protein